MPRFGLTLCEIGVDVYITIEQERDPRHQTSVLADLTASRALLSRIGY